MFWCAPHSHSLVLQRGADLKVNHSVLFCAVLWWTGSDWMLASSLGSSGTPGTWSSDKYWQRAVMKKPSTVHPVLLHWMCRAGTGVRSLAKLFCCRQLRLSNPILHAPFFSSISTSGYCSKPGGDQRRRIQILLMSRWVMAYGVGCLHLGLLGRLIKVLSQVKLCCWV